MVSHKYDLFLVVLFLAIGGVLADVIIEHASKSISMHGVLWVGAFFVVTVINAFVVYLLFCGGWYVCRHLRRGKTSSNS
jgi:hypothetical protein